MSLILGLKHFQKFGEVGGWIAEICFGPNLWLGAWSLDQAQQYILECVKLYKILNLANEIKKNNSFLDNNFYIFNMNIPLHNLILFGSITRLNGTTRLRFSILKSKKKKIV